MAWFNEEAAALLREYAELTQITGGDVFRARNYEKAARSVRGWGDDIGRLDVSELRGIPGVGASIAAKIAEYRQTGTIAALEDLRAKIPPGVLELTRVPDLGPKRALQLSRDLGVQSVDDLAAAIAAGRLDGLAGFGARSEERIAAGIEVYRQGRERVLLDVALRTATEMAAALTPLSQRCAYAGSLRRWRETIRGYAYYAVTDHAPDLIMQRMTDEKMLAQREQVRALEAGLVLLHGTELNIGPDGSVDWDADFLAGFDICVASVHSHFEQSRAEMTRRFVTACENPHVNVIGHPLARRIGKRPPVEVDFGELFRACARTGTAQRGWLTPDDVINTWPLDRLRAFLRKDR